MEPNTLMSPKYILSVCIHMNTYIFIHTNFACVLLCVICLFSTGVAVISVNKLLKAWHLFLEMTAMLEAY